MTTDAFNGRRARLARMFAGLTQAELAERLEVAQAWVGQVESGTRPPSSDRVRGLGEILRVRPQFFYGPLVNEFTEEECHFRRRKTSSAAARNQAMATGTLFASVVHYLEEHVVDFPEDTIPHDKATSSDAIEKAAARCRLAWNLKADRPISNMVRSVENAGALVTRCAGSDKVDAFSRGTSGRKVIIINETKGATRSRFDVAHELGHLVLHAGMMTGDGATEDQANAFASAFLMPSAIFAHEFPRTSRIDWNAMIALKQRWGVSLAAIIYRAHALGLISAVQYTSAQKYLSWNGWRKVEPAEPDLEKPEAVRQALELLEEDGDSIADVASAINVDESVVLEVLGSSYTPKPKPPTTFAGTSSNVINLASERLTRRR